MPLGLMLNMMSRQTSVAHVREEHATTLARMREEHETVLASMRDQSAALVRAREENEAALAGEVEQRAALATARREQEAVLARLRGQEAALARLDELHQETFGKCAVCMERARECAYQRCGHFCVCRVCAAQVSSVCPICKAPSQVIDIFIS